MKRFQVYKKFSDGTIIHVRSILANSRLEANRIVNNEKLDGGGGPFFVTGLIINIGDDISSNFPPHVNRRINNLQASKFSR